MARINAGLLGVSELGQRFATARENQLDRQATQQQGLLQTGIQAAGLLSQNKQQATANALAARKQDEIERSAQATESVAATALSDQEVNDIYNATRGHLDSVPDELRDEQLVIISDQLSKGKGIPREQLPNTVEQFNNFGIQLGQETLQPFSKDPRPTPFTDEAKANADVQNLKDSGREDEANALQIQIRENSIAKVAEEGAKAEVDADKTTFNQENVLRDDYNKDSAAFKAVNTKLGQVKAGAALKSPTGDLSMLFSLMKIFDPTSVVRESEQASVLSAASVPQRVRGMLTRMWNGESLTPAQRADIVKTAESQVAKAAEEQRLRNQIYTDISNRRGVDPRNVVIVSVPDAPTEPVGPVDTGISPDTTDEQIAAALEAMDLAEARANLPTEGF